MKVLYIGNYGDIGSGWARAAQNNIRALVSQNIEVIPRRVKYTHQEVPQDILVLEDNTSKADVCIQHVLPPNLKYSGKFKKNIAYTVVDGESLAGSGWEQHLNLMDEVWVPSEFCKSKLKLEVPVHVVPHCIDPIQILQAQPFNLQQQTGYEFIFGCVADFHPRKDLVSLIKAYYLAFPEDEPVGLCIKSPNRPVIEKMCADIRAGMKINNNKPEIIIDNWINEKQLYSLLKSIDVFVSASSGEAFSMPVLEAIVAGKTPVVNSYWCSFKDVYPVKYHMEPCFGLEFMGAYTSFTQIGRVDILDLAAKMREAYTDKNRQKKSLDGMRAGMEYSYEAIGEKMVSLI